MTHQEEPDTSVVDVTPGAIVASTFEPTPQRKSSWLLTTVVIASLIGVGGVGVAHIASQNATIANQQERIVSLNETVGNLVTENGALVENSQVLFDQVLALGATPEGVDPGDFRGPQGLQGLRGLPGKDGDKGDKGDPGDTGNPGKDGQGGKDGKDGTPGAPGEKGDKGDKGDPGDAGAPGRGLQSISCSAPNEMTFTYTDDSVEVFTIPCVPNP